MAGTAEVASRTGAHENGPPAAAGGRAPPGPGYVAIWMFLAVFLIYPLLRIFYDAFTDEAGRLTMANFAEFGHDAYYVRSLWNSILLGLGTVLTTTILGFA